MHNRGNNTPVPPPNGLYDDDLLVADLIAENGREWNDASLALHLREEDRASIKSIPLIDNNGPDTLYWRLTPTGRYSVKSAYWLGVLGNHYVNSTIDENVWRGIWRMNGPPKLRHFLWRACTNTLAVGAEMHRRHIQESSLCKRCNSSVETSKHALFMCGNAKKIWAKYVFWDDIKDRIDDNFSTTFARLMEVKDA
uniref:Reverse transcriptase zinc-binding domain-containing protein n=1 Tax=Chenopodium quinoa TaxID=63459 RepID=A0A803LUS5_CHEQI